MLNCYCDTCPNSTERKDNQKPRMWFKVQYSDEDKLFCSPECAIVWLQGIIQQRDEDLEVGMTD